MNPTAGLSLDQAPPIGAPLRFFLTGPLFGLAAAFLLLWQGPALFASRWTPALLGATHLLTLGYMSMVMMGAILQMLPVVAGAPVPHPVGVARLVHGLATAGVALFALGMVFTLHPLLTLALPVLGAATLLFAATVLAALRHALPRNATARAIRFAVLMLVATSLAGLVLLENHAVGWWLTERYGVANLHLAWGLLGWMGILVVGVSYQVVPMFQLTPPYPDRYTRWAIPLLFVLIAVLLPAIFLHNPPHTALGVLLAGGFASFALITLRLQSQRRRKLPDVTLDFWRGGIACLLAAIALWIAGQAFPSLAAENGYDIFLGIAMIVGFALSVINGMLYKIVPFLVWFHLQSRRRPGGPIVPNTRQILAEDRTRWQMRLHFGAVGTLLCAAWSPQWFAYPGAVLFGASCLWLWVNIVSAMRTYREVDTQLLAASPAA